MKKLIFGICVIFLFIFGGIRYHKYSEIQCLKSDMEQSLYLKKKIAFEISIMLENKKYGLINMILEDLNACIEINSHCVDNHMDIIETTFNDKYLFVDNDKILKEQIDLINNFKSSLSKE